MDAIPPIRPSDLPQETSPISKNLGDPVDQIQGYIKDINEWAAQIASHPGDTALITYYQNLMLKASNNILSIVQSNYNGAGNGAIILQDAQVITQYINNLANFAEQGDTYMINTEMANLQSQEGQLITDINSN